MNFQVAHFSREHRYAIGTELDSGRHYLAIPVSNALVDYEEHYVLTDRQFRDFLHDSAAARAFADSCRRRELDDLLFRQPGSDRGTAR